MANIVVFDKRAVVIKDESLYRKGSALATI